MFWLALALGGVVAGVAVAALLVAALRRLLPRLGKPWVIIAAAVVTPFLVSQLAFGIAAANAVPGPGTDGPSVFAVLLLVSALPTACAFAASLPTAFWMLRRVPR